MSFNVTWKVSSFSKLSCGVLHLQKVYRDCIGRDCIGRDSYIGNMKPTLQLPNVSSCSYSKMECYYFTSWPWEGSLL